MSNREQRGARLAREAAQGEALAKLIDEPLIVAFFTEQEASLIDKMVAAEDEATVIERARDVRVLRTFRQFLQEKATSARMARGELERMAKQEGSA